MNLNEIQDMKKINFKDLHAKETIWKFSETEMNSNIKSLFKFWDTNQNNSIQVPHFIWDLLSLGLAPNVNFITKMLSVLYHCTPDDVIKLEITREDF